MTKRIASIMGATGRIGGSLCDELLQRHWDVRAIGRSAAKLARLQSKGATPHAAKFDDAEALTKAFHGASVVFSFIPPFYEEDDLGAYQARVGSAVVEAIQRAGVTRVVNLSSIGADLPEGTGPIKGLHRHEARLALIEKLNVVHLRSAYFMENLLGAIPMIREQGVHGSPIRADLPIPMIATPDIAARAADLFDRIEGTTIEEIGGPRDITMAEATRVIGKAIGKPDLAFVQVPYPDAKKAMIQAGMMPETAGLMIELCQGMNEGRIKPVGKLHRGKLGIEEFATVFARNYRGE